MTVTLRDIAARANVSTRAVGYALAGGGRVGADTRRRIEQIASEMGYRLNAAARTTRTGRFDAATLLLGTDRFRSNLPTVTLAAVHHALREQGMHLHVVMMHDAELACPDLVGGLLSETRSDGLIINFTHGVPTQLDESIRQYRIPAVWLNRKLPRRAAYLDDYATASRATRALLERGHRKIVYADLSVDLASMSTMHYSHLDRRNGYERAMREAGLEPVFWSGERAVPATQRASWFRQKLAGDRPTAVLSYGSSITFALMIAMQIDGISCPQDLSLLEFSEEPRNEGDFRIGYAEVASAEAGRIAVDMLKQLVDDRDSDLPARAVVGSVEPRDSVRLLT